MVTSIQPAMTLEHPPVEECFDGYEFTRLATLPAAQFDGMGTKPFMEVVNLCERATDIRSIYGPSEHRIFFIESEDGLVSYFGKSGKTGVTGVTLRPHGEIYEPVHKSKSSEKDFYLSLDLRDVLYYGRAVRVKSWQAETMGSKPSNGPIHDKYRQLRESSTQHTASPWAWIGHLAR